MTSTACWVIEPQGSPKVYSRDTNADQHGKNQGDEHSRTLGRPCLPAEPGSTVLVGYFSREGGWQKQALKPRSASWQEQAPRARGFVLGARGMGQQDLVPDSAGFCDMGNPPSIYLDCAARLLVLSESMLVMNANITLPRRTSGFSGFCIVGVSAVYEYQSCS